MPLSVTAGDANILTLQAAPEGRYFSFLVVVRQFERDVLLFLMQFLGVMVLSDDFLF